MYKSTIWLLVGILWLFTIKFELFNNLLLGVIFVLNYKNIRVNLILYYFTTIIVVMLVSYYFFIENITFLKFAGFLFRFLILVLLASMLVDVKINLSSVLEKVFYIHSIAIFLCYLIPPLHEAMRVFFAYNGGSPDRYSGFIQGFDFVPLITMIYLAYEYLNLDKKINLKFMLKLLLAVLVCLFSGRYSMLPITALILFVIFNGKYMFKKLAILLGAMSVFLLVFDEIVRNIYLTTLVVIDFATIGLDADFSYANRGEGVTVEGQYNLSPITLAMEIIKPFVVWRDHILPSTFSVVDTGPSYLILNLGFIGAFFMYVFFFIVIKVYLRKSIPIIVMAVFLLIDLKFRSAFSLMPTLWLLINHVNYVKNLRLT